MSTVDLLMFGSSCFLFGVSLFSANLLILQDSQGVHRPLALFCGIQALLQGLVVLLMAGGPTVGAAAGTVLNFISLPLSMMAAPLFWLFVQRLTSEEGGEPIRWKALHLAPILLGVLFVAVIESNRAQMLGEAEAAAAAAAGEFDALRLEMAAPDPFGSLRLAMFGIEVVYFSQIAVYLVLSCWRISAYRVRLKDLFASTEDRELNWILWIAACTAVYLVVDFGTVIADLFTIRVLPFPEDLSVGIQLALPIVVIWIIAVWGTRQKPGLYRPDERAPQVPDRPEEDPAAKYGRSALTPEHARRIARKIKAVMENDLLYRDPNLSLWGLANRIGATSNHVSQTLNETLAESFFDHVNKWRVRDAIEQLTTTDQSILAIAYAVGFNSRSPFYKAFKRETGMTPTELRARLAAAGPREPAMPIRDDVLTGPRASDTRDGDDDESDREGLHPHHRGLPA